MSAGPNFTKYTDKDGNAFYYDNSTNKVRLMEDTKGNRVVYKSDGKTIDYVLDVSRGKIDYFYKPNSTILSYTIDSYGLRSHYLSDGKTLDFQVDSKGNYIGYRLDGKTPCWRGDKEGRIVFYRDDGVTVDYRRDEKGNCIYYREDGVTVDYVRDANGDETHYATVRGIRRVAYRRVWEKDENGNSRLVTKFPKTSPRTTARVSDKSKPQDGKIARTIKRGQMSEEPPITIIRQKKAAKYVI